MDTDSSPHHDASPGKGLLVVDDHELLRLGLRTLVQSHAQANGQVVQVFEAHSLQDALTTFGDNAAAIQLVLLDLHLPDAHGLSGVEAFMAEFPEAHVAVLSGVSDPGLQREALALGARAYLTKSGDLAEVVRYITASHVIRIPHTAHQDTMAHDSEDDTGTPASAATSATSGRTVRTASGEWIPITARQAQVLDWILTGWSNRQIADHANLSEGTVKNHVSTLLLLLGARSRAQLISQLR